MSMFAQTKLLNKYKSTIFAMKLKLNSNCYKHVKESVNEMQRQTATTEVNLINVLTNMADTLPPIMHLAPE